MTVHKLLIGITLLGVLGLAAGSVYSPDTLLMSLADTGPLYAVLRGIIAVLLVALLVTDPPRSHALRLAIGIWGVVLAGLSLQLLFAYQLHLLDAIVFMEVAIIFGIEALETRRSIPVNQKHSPAKKIPVLSV